jgi:hypothetical protein
MLSELLPKSQNHHRSMPLFGQFSMILMIGLWRRDIATSPASATSYAA